MFTLISVSVTYKLPKTLKIVYNCCVINNIQASHFKGALGFFYELKGFTHKEVKCTYKK